MLDGTKLLAAWHNVQASVLNSSVIHVQDRRNHRIAFMRKIRIVLVHGKRRTDRRRFIVQLRVVQLNVGTN